jgi:hypothetical protein
MISEAIEAISNCPVARNEQRLIKKCRETAEACDVCIETRHD